MPHLSYCGRYFRLASDELWLPAFCTSFLRVSWIMFVIIGTVTYSTYTTNCAEYRHMMLTYLSSTIILAAGCIVNEVLILLLSLQGTVTETRFREQNLPKYLNARLVLCALQFTSALFGCSISNTVGKSSREDCKYPHLLEFVFLYSNIVYQLVDTMSVVCCCFVFSAHEIEKGDSKNSDTGETTPSAPASVWGARCKMFCKAVQVSTKFVI